MVQVKTVVESPTFLIQGLTAPPQFHAPAVIVQQGAGLPGVPAGDNARAAYRTAQAANRLLAAETKYVGDGERIEAPISGSLIAACGMAGHVAMSIVGAVALGMYGDAPPVGAALSLRDTGIFCVFSVAPILVAGLTAAYSKGTQLVQQLKAGKRELSASALAPLRVTFDAPTTSPLQRMVIGELAQIYRASLDGHRVKGSEARALLDDLGTRGRAIEASDEQRQAASAAVAVFFATHSVDGEHQTRSANVRQLEDILAQTAEPFRAQLREVIYDLLAADDKNPLGGEYAERLHAVLSGEREPRTIASERDEMARALPGATRLTNVRV